MIGKEQAQAFLNGVPELRSLRVREVQPLAGDASNRSYYRVVLTPEAKSQPGSVILLQYGSARGPAFRQAKLPTQQQALEALSKELASLGVPVPRLYLYQAASGVFVFEDCGDRSLSALASGQREALVDRLFDRDGPAWIERMFERALDVVVQLQELPVNPQSVAYQRWLEFENYRAEAQEFIDFVAAARGVTKGGREVLEQQFDALCETIMSFPKSLSHFDFHGHNILVRDDGTMVLIDYQDACLVSPARDVVSLLNDRGMDEVLGKSMQQRLLRYFHSKRAALKNFPHCYNMTLLHWDLRVSGRFHKLGIEKKTTRYQQWIPGTLRRLGRTLVRSYGEVHGMDRLLEVVVQLCPEVREGTLDPWPLDLTA